MVRIPLTPRRVRVLFLGITAFTAGCLTTGAGFLCFYEGWTVNPFRLKTVHSATPVVKQIPFPGTSDSVDGAFEINSNSVFSSQGPLPEAVATVGLPGAEPVKILPGFLLLYDRRTRVPRWTLEHLTPTRLNTLNNPDVVDRSQFDFFEDISEKNHFRSTNEDYLLSGFDRGHMAAAGNHRLDADSMKKSFVLSNIAPQVGIGFNRGVWKDLEQYIRAMARRSANVIVVTGPLFLPSPERSAENRRHVCYEVIGVNNVAVPTHFFKAAAVQQVPGGAWRTFAWVLPNKQLPDGSRLNAFIVSLKDVERAAGLEIFPNLYK